MSVMAALLGPATIKPPPVIFVFGLAREVRASPFCTLGITTSLTYSGEVSVCSISPSETSPATLQL